MFYPVLLMFRWGMSINGDGQLLLVGETTNDLFDAVTLETSKRYVVLFLGNRVYILIIVASRPK